MIKSLDLRKINSSKYSSKTVLSCNTELDKTLLEKNICGVYKLDICEYPNADDYKNMSQDEIREYIKGYYENVLSKLNPEKVATQIRYTLLVSDERTDSLAKRHIIAEWINLHIEEEIRETEIKQNENGSFEYVDLERPKFIKSILKDVIRNSKDMKGFNSIRALYLYEKGEMLDLVADRFKEKYGEDCEQYIEYSYAASYNKELAYEVEREYYDEVMTHVRKQRGYGKRKIRVSSK